jgi:hypothetical protein
MQKIKEAYMRSYYNHTSHYLARVLVYRAVKSGKIQKPQACYLCGKIGYIEGHHSDYAKPLDVEWLCQDCHTNIDKQLTS